MYGGHRGAGGGYGGGGLGFGPPFTPPIVKQLLIALAAVFVAQAFLPLGVFGAVVPVRVWQEGWLWQPFTYMWLHGGLAHIAINAFMLWMFGSPLAMAWGTRRFFNYYMVCGVGAGVIIASLPYLLYGIGVGPDYALRVGTVGASGAIYGVILAYSLTWPDRTIMLIFPPVAFRAIWLIPIIFFMNILFDTRGDISHVGHLGGVVAGWIFLRWRGEAAGAPISWDQLKLRWRRYRMRQKLRAVQYEDWEAKRREREERDRRLH